MRIKKKPSEYDVVVSRTGNTLVRIALQRGKEYSEHLTQEEAKRVAYALLLAADGIEP